MAGKRFVGLILVSLGLALIAGCVLWGVVMTRTNDHTAKGADSDGEMSIAERAGTTCNTYTSCGACTSAPSWLGGCRWCNIDNKCHATGSLLNACHVTENIKDTELCSCSAGCSPARGFGPEVCSWYVSKSSSLPADPANWVGEDFLLPAYATSAQCACSGGDSKLWSATAASCVRTNLLAQHKALPAATKQAMRAATVGGSPYSDWQNYVPQVYQMHVDAYKSCCCAGTPAPYITWQAVFSPLNILPCSVWTPAQPPVGLIQDVLMFGRCGCGW